jgi:uncharacterized protein (TIGR02996 family)
MTTEDDFQKALNRRWNDWQTHLVFADWLEEQGDPRAEGYRALGVLRRVPNRRPGSYFRFLWSSDLKDRVDWTDRYVLPADWYRHLTENDLVYFPDDEPDRTLYRSTRKYALEARESRRSAEDKAALAFTELPAERRAELLSTVLEEKKCKK